MPRKGLYPDIHFIFRSRQPSRQPTLEKSPSNNSRGRGNKRQASASSTSRHTLNDVLTREEGNIGLFIYISPQSFIVKFSYSLTFFYWILVGWISKLSVQKFESLLKTTLFNVYIQFSQFSKNNNSFFSHRIINRFSRI